MRAARRRRVEPEVRRQEIIEAAEKLLTVNGPDVRVEDIVHEAGAAKGTFYLFFPCGTICLKPLAGALSLHSAKIANGCSLQCGGYCEKRSRRRRNEAS